MSDKLKIPLKETWQSTLRMLKILSKADKGLLPTMLLYQALTALTPYVAIFFSARLLSELSGARDPVKLRFIKGDAAYRVSDAIFDDTDTVFAADTGLHFVGSPRV